MRYDPTIPPPGRPAIEHYCACGHLRIQHSDTGCPWCPCTERHTKYREAS